MREHETVFLVGSGAVENAWNPVIEALKGIGFTDLSSANGAVFAMASLVYMARLSHVRKDDPLGQHADEICGKLSEARRAIAHALQKAETTSTLTIRSAFHEVFRKLVCEGSRRVYLITTNWDGVVQAAAKNTLAGASALYLHGQASNPEHLYLPSEIVEEPYRVPNETAYLNNARAHAVRVIGSATRLVLYGLAVSPLDVELGNLIFAGTHGSQVKEIHVVDPAHEEVRERIATLGPVGTAELPIYSRAPDKLSVVHRFPST